MKFSIVALFASMAFAAPAENSITGVTAGCSPGTYGCASDGKGHLYGIAVCGPTGNWILQNRCGKECFFQNGQPFCR